MTGRGEDIAFPRWKLSVARRRNAEWHKGRNYDASRLTDISGANCSVRMKVSI